MTPSHKQWLVSARALKVRKKLWVVAHRVGIVLASSSTVMTKPYFKPLSCAQQDAMNPQQDASLGWRPFRLHPPGLPEMMRRGEQLYILQSAVVMSCPGLAICTRTWASMQEATACNNTAAGQHPPRALDSASVYMKLYLHVQKGVIAQVAQILHVRLHAPIKVKACQQRVPVGKAAEVPSSQSIMYPMEIHY